MLCMRRELDFVKPSVAGAVDHSQGSQLHCQQRSKARHCAVGKFNQKGEKKGTQGGDTNMTSVI